MTMQRWEPMRDMMSLRNAMDKLFEDSFVRPSSFWEGGESETDLALDMYQTDKEVVVKASLPGFKPEEVDISISGDVLTIRAEKKEEKKIEEKDYFYQERHFGSMSRMISIPVEVNADKAQACFDNGVLTLSLPKTEEVKPKQIKVKATPAIEGAKKSGEVKAEGKKKSTA